jgi:ATP-binding cassette subfamily B protein
VSLLSTFFWRYARPYAVYYLLGIVALLVTNGIAVWIPHEIESAINYLNSTGSVADSNVWEPVRNIIALALILAVVRTASRALFFNPGRAIERNVANDMFSFYMTRSEQWHQNHSSGDLIARATHDVLNLRGMTGYGFLQFTNIILLVAMILSQMISMSPLLTLYALLPLLLGILVLRLSIRYLMRLVRQSQIELAEVEQRVLEGLKGVRLVRDFGAQKLIVDGFEEGNQNLLKLRERMASIVAFHLPLVYVSGHIAIGVLLLWVANQAGEHSLNIGEIAAYIAYLTMLTAVLVQTGWMMNVVQRGLVSLRRINEIMPLHESHDEPPVESFDPMEIGDPSQGLRLDSLSVDLDENSILKDISLSARPGQHIGILGTVGSGKSTLAAVMTGQLRNFDGKGTLHGVPLEELTVEAIGSAVRLVPDLPFLFTQQLDENVAFNEQQGTIDSEKVRAALAVASFNPDEENLTRGIETLVGEKGIALSGGQKQRITLARAIYAGGTILILDDVLSAVDHKTEHIILERLERWRRSDGNDIALINISNRVSALEGADEVIVLDKGQIIERGTPEELAKGTGLYATTRNLQRALSSSEGGHKA